MLDKFYFESNGTLFERELGGVIGAICEHSWGTKSFKYSNSYEDQYRGTDFWALGVPVDVTLDITKSSHTTIFKTEINFTFGTFIFGLRTGNEYGTFEKPVLVIGVKYLLHLNIKNYIDIVCSMKPKLKEVLEAGMDEYWSCVRY